MLYWLCLIFFHAFCTNVCPSGRENCIISSTACLLFLLLLRPLALVTASHVSCRSFIRPRSSFTRVLYVHSINQCLLIQNYLLLLTLPSSSSSVSERILKSSELTAKYNLNNLGNVWPFASSTVNPICLQVNVMANRTACCNEVNRFTHQWIDLSCKWENNGL